MSFQLMYSPYTSKLLEYSRTFESPRQTSSNELNAKVGILSEPARLFSPIAGPGRTIVQQDKKPSSVMASVAVNNRLRPA